MNLNKLITNTLSNALFKIFTLVLGLVSTPIIVNAIGQENFGLIILGGTIIGYFSFLGLSIPSGLVKYLAEFNAKKHPTSVNTLFNTTFWFFLGIGLSVCLIVILFVLLGGLKLFNISSENLGSANKLLFIASGLAVFSWPAISINSSLKGLQEFHSLNKIYFFTHPFSLIATIISALLNCSVEIIFLVSNSGYILNWIFEFILLKKKLSFLKISLYYFKKNIFLMLFSFSFWLLLIQIARQLIYQTDHIILGVYLPVSTLTIYYVITKPFKLIQYASGIFNSAIMPAVSERYSEQGQSGIEPFIYRASSYFNSFLAPISILGLFLSGPFIKLWMGEEYSEYFWIAQLACAFQIVWQSNAVLGEVYSGVGEVKKISLVAIGSAVVNVVLSIILVQYLGVAGVVLGTIIAGIFTVPFYYIFIFPDLMINRWKYFKSILRAQIPTIVLSIIIIPFWNKFQMIDSWVLLITVGSIFLCINYTFNFIYVIEKVDKLRFYNMLNNFYTKHLIS